MKISSIRDYNFAVNCNYVNGQDSATDDHNAFPSYNYKKSIASFANPAFSNYATDNTGYLLGGVVTWITKTSALASDYTSYYYSDSTPINVGVYTEDGYTSIATGGAIVSTYNAIGGLSYSSTYVITGYSGIGLLDAALNAAHSSVPFGTTFGNKSNSLNRQSSYTFPVASAIGPHTSEKSETKIRWGDYAKVGYYFKATWNVITWTPEYRAWWVEHLAGNPEPYPEPTEKPTLGPMLTATWTGPASGLTTDPSRYTSTQYSIAVPATGHGSEVINQKIYGYRSASFGCPPNPSPFIY